MKRFKSIIFVAVASLIAVTQLSIVPAAMAQSNAASSALSIAPKKTYLVEPGDSVKDKLTIRNIDSTSALKLYLRVVDFSYQDDSGTPKLILDQDAEPTTWSLRSHLKVPESVTVRAGGTESVDLSVKMPAKIGAGSYYSAIMYSTTAPDGGNVGLAASGVTLVFVTVPGAVSESLTLKQHGPYDPKTKKYQTFSMDEPQVIGYTLQNEGNVTEAPVGSITLKGWFGIEHKIVDINPNKSLALIGQTRTFQACIKLASQTGKDGTDAQKNACVSPGLWPGYYSTSIDIFYGQNGNLTKEISKNGFFWYLPLWFIIVSIVALLVIAFYVWRTIVFFRGGSFRIGVQPRQRKSSRRRR